MEFLIEQLFVIDYQENYKAVIQSQLKTH